MIRNQLFCETVKDPKKKISPPSLALNFYSNPDKVMIGLIRIMNCFSSTDPICILIKLNERGPPLPPGDESLQMVI